VAERTCSFPGCPTRHYARGWCNAHYKRWLKLGETAIVMKKGPRVPYRRDLGERFWSHVDKGDGTGCWLWTASKLNTGRGCFRINGRTVLAHRFAYELLVGPIPDGLPLDHVKANGCTSVACVKVVADEHGPAHLEPVTQQENCRRGYWGTKTHCPKGHPYDLLNTYTTSKGHRQCRTCNQARSRARHATSS
jgi:hypothetical protein